MLSGSSVAIEIFVEVGPGGPVRRQPVVAVAVPVAGVPFIPLRDEPAG